MKINKFLIISNYFSVMYFIYVTKYIFFFLKTLSELRITRWIALCIYYLVKSQEFQCYLYSLHRHFAEYFQLKNKSEPNTSVSSLFQ